MCLGGYFDDLRGENENPASEVGCWPTRCQRVKSLVPLQLFEYRRCVCGDLV
jgi:hypothetical protein